MRALVLLLLLLPCSLFVGGGSIAQELVEKPDPGSTAEKKPVDPKKPLDPEAAAAKAAADAKAAAELEKLQAEALKEILQGTTELLPEQVANFEKWIPHTFKRLRDRSPVHIVTLGDSVTRYMSYDENRENSHHAYHGVFAAKLADEFFYTGGVRDVRPTKGHEPKLEPLLGEELTLENLGMNGRVSLHALSRITTDGLVNRPDLVMINFGINDALLGMGLATYVEALERSVRYVKSTGADVMLFGPSHTTRNDSPGELALTRAYSGAMSELASRLGVFYFDLGGVTTSAPGTPEGQSAERALAAIIASNKAKSFDHGVENQDGLHPSPAAHQAMGTAIFSALRDGGESDPYRLTGFLTLGSGGKAVLEFKIKNLQEVAAKGLLFLMPASGMVPEKTSVAFDLAAGKGKVFRVSYKAPSGRFDLPADAPRVFIPLIVSDTLRSYAPVFPAPVTPVGVVWQSGTRDLSHSAFEVKCDLVAKGAAAVNGSYKASWNGQESHGEFDLKPGGNQTLALKFSVPAAGGKFSVRDNLVLSITTSGGTIEFVRRMEASRNLGLGESVNMVNPDKYVRGEASPPGRVQFMVEASAKALVLNFDVDGIDLEGGEQLTPLILEFQLDARGFGKRRKFGFVDIVRVKIGLDGIAERLSELRLAVFGDWYDRTLDNAELSAQRTILPDGRARYSIRIPRSYLYLHEFKLGNGNSLLGVNADLAFAKAGQPANPYPAERRFSLVKSGINKHSAESLTVIELVEKATGRWSLRLD